MTRMDYGAAIDARIALGADPNPDHPDKCCAYCWPALVAATHWDATGNPCCGFCEGRQNLAARTQE